ncbi:regulatory protein RecX [Leucobacter aridicollis]|uniref:regulatory protein RecX n=1 Tax=Leucobacter aridicollis TaxID=283878 RepID=UPI0021060401|nr:regulatory protein RecX [Leucobacter aridicollis]UTX52270.1 regulatory protein RecX [Leucobacter aridicollis]
MAVRFLPPPEERPTPQREDRGDLAEVIEFRSRLRRPEPAGAEAEPSLPASDTTVPRGAARLGVHADPGRSGSGPGDSGQIDSGESDGAGWTGPGLIRLDAASRALVTANGEAPDAELGEHRGGVDAARSDDSADGPTAYETAVKLLARKPLSTGELHRALVSAGHPEIDAEEAVAKCTESLYLDDTDLASAVATKLRDAKGESKARIRQKLRERHLPDAAIESALADLDDDEEMELLRQTASDRARRMVGLDRQTAERRLLGFLARRGWSGERATRAAKDALDGVARGASGGRGSVRFR